MISRDRSQEIVQWLQLQIQLDEARAHYEDLERDTQLLIGSPGGWIPHFENRIVSNFQPLDEIWLYDSGPESWEKLHGEKGMALVRDGTVIAIIVECRN